VVGGFQKFDKSQNSQYEHILDYVLVRKGYPNVFRRGAVCNTGCSSQLAGLTTERNQNVLKKFSFIEVCICSKSMEKSVESADQTPSIWR